MGEPAEAAVLLLVEHTTAQPVLPLFALVFRSLYGSTPVALWRYALYLLAVYGPELVPGSPFPASDVGKGLGLAVAGGLVHALGKTLARFERTERLLSSIVAGSTDVVSILDAELRIGWQGSSIRRVLGHDPQALVGRCFLELVTPDDWDALQDVLAQADAPGSARTVNLRILHADGGFREVEAVVGNHLHDPHMEGWLLNLRDATERRRLERDRAELAEQRARDAASRLEVERLLEHVEVERERQALEERLRRSQRLESVGQLAGGIAHDFNNLLVVILNYAGFVREELAEDDARAADLREIEKAAERGAALTRQLLLFSQRKVTTPVVLDLDEVIEGLDGLLTRSLGRQVEMRYARSGELWPVEADPGNVEQILVNLVVNARDAIGGAGSIVVATANMELTAADATGLDVPAGRYVRLTVTDDGCGMEPATLGRAFEPFFTTKPQGEGTGLGLATVYGIVTQAGGGVSLRSERGAGTTVSIHLPVTDKSPAPPAVEEPRERPRTGAERILVVDDEASVRALVERVLTSAGYRVEVAASGDAALACWAGSAEPFDLVLSDVVMPGLSGLELAAHLHTADPGQRVRLMSGFSEELLSREGVEADRILTKPFNAEALLAAVRDDLERPASGALGRVATA